MTSSARSRSPRPSSARWCAAIPLIGPAGLGPRPQRQLLCCCDDCCCACFMDGSPCNTTQPQRGTTWLMVASRPPRADGRGWLPSRGAAGARHDTYHMELDLCDPHHEDLTPNLAAPRCQRAGRKWWVLAALTRAAVPCVGAGNRQVQGGRRASAAMRQPGATAGPSSAGRVEASTPIEGMSTLAASSVKARRLAELRQQLQQERAQNDRLEAELESYKRQIADQGL